MPDLWDDYEPKENAQEERSAPEPAREATYPHFPGRLLDLERVENWMFRDEEQKP